MARLHQTYLMTADLERSREFYETVLDLDVSEAGENSVAFETGGAELKLDRDHDEEVLAQFGMEPPGDDRGRGVVVVLEPDDVDAVHDRATEFEDCEVLTGPTNTDWGRYLTLVADPDGYVLEVSRPA